MVVSNLGIEVLPDYRNADAKNRLVHDCGRAQSLYFRFLADANHANHANAGRMLSGSDNDNSNFRFGSLERLWLI